MRNKLIKQQIKSELADYFDQASKRRCPPSMKQELYERIGIDHNTWFKPAMAFSFVAIAASGLIWHEHSQEQKLLTAQHDLEVAMHYMQKVSNKTLSGVNTHGIKPAIIVPISKSIAKI